MSETKIVAGNWKMNKNKAEVVSFFEEAKSYSFPSQHRYIICPSPTLMDCALETVQKLGLPFEIYSQNCAWEDSGAYTGEMSPLQLKELGLQGTLVGHSERRQYFGESIETTLKRSEAALKAGLEVMFCIGEELSVREAGKTEELLKEQLQGLFADFFRQNREKITVAYEPVWAIGTGVTATDEQVAETHGYLVDLMQKNDCPYPLLYGGSVKPNNFKSLASIPTVDGGLVGGASLKWESFQALVDCLTA